MMANNPKTAGEVTQIPKEKMAQKSHVEYYLDNEKLVFPLDKPITTRVMHVYHTGGWVSQKWGPPPNADGSPATATPSTAPAVVSTSPSTTANSAVISPSTPSTDLVAKPASGLPSGMNRPGNPTPSQTASSSATIETASKHSITSNGSLSKPSNLAGRIGALPSSSPSATAGSSNTSPSALSGIPRPGAPRPTTSTPLTTIGAADAIPITKAASVSRGLPSNVVRPANKTYIGPDLLRAPVTAWTSSLYRGKSTGKSLRGGIGEDFEVVSKAELDDEFDVLDNEGPSAGNGATKYRTAILSDRDGALTAGWD